MPAPKQDRAKGRKLYCYLSEDEAKRLTALAEKEIRTLNAQITIAVREYLDRHDGSSDTEKTQQ